MHGKLFVFEIKDGRDRYLYDLLKDQGELILTLTDQIDVFKQIVYLMSLTTNITESLVNSLKKDSILFCRELDSNLKTLAKSKGITVFCYFDHESFITKNAYLTAEGTLKYIIELTPETIARQKALVIGFGRVGKAVAKILNDNYLDVTVTNRTVKTLSEAELFGVKSLPFADLLSKISEFSIIINTVPTLILEGEMLKNTIKDSLIIDLASKPGGVDFIEAKKLGINAVHALGIPGKVAPKTCALCLLEIINKELKGNDK